MELTAQDVLHPGQIIAGRYEIRSRLGSGGMGAVFHAHDRVLDEDVALKVILPAALGDPSAIERFRDEVKIARKITHPNVCRVFDVSEDKGLTFLTMELVEGSTLRQALSAGPIDAARALEILQQVASGVSAAHEKGVIHRDLKPENVLVRRDGRCVVADFGLARDPGQGDATSEGAAGTPGYMSPEQRRGEPIDVRSDVFALGILGIELLTGRSPAIGGSEKAVSLSAVRPVPVRREAPALEVPGMAAPKARALQDVFARALAERPEERFASAADFGAALARASSVTAAGRRRWVVALAVVTAVAVLIIAFAVRARREGAPLVSERDERAMFTMLPFENTSGDASWDGLSRSAPEAIRAGLRTMPEVALAEAAPGTAFLVRGHVQRIGSVLRLSAQIEVAPGQSDALPSEPVEIDVSGNELAPALEALRGRVLDEARIVVARYRRWQRANLGTTNPTARENLLAYYRMIGLLPRSEHFEPGLRLLNDAVAADVAYVPARVERAFLLALGAGGGTKIERLGRALADLDDARRARPDDQAAIVMRCRITQLLVETAPNDAASARAMEACQAALIAAPSSAHVHIAIARLHDRRCEDERAMRMLERAVELDRSLSVRALGQLIDLARQNRQMLVADRASAALVAFQDEEKRLGPRALGRRAGAPEARGAYLSRGEVLFELGRFAEAKEALSRELAEVAESRGSPFTEATALRGLLRVAAAEGKAVPRSLVERLEVIEASYRARLATKPEEVQDLARSYRTIDPAAAASWVDRLSPAETCEEALQRARIYVTAGKDERARATLALCSPTEEWERSCIAQLFPHGLTR